MAQRPANDHAKTVRNALSKNVVVDIGARVGYLVTRFFIPPFVLAHVGLEAYGLWATVFIIVSYVGISTFGISNVYIKYVAEYTARGEPERANALLSTGLVSTSALCLIIFALLLIWWPLVVNWLQVPDALQDAAYEVILLVVGIFLASLAFSGFSNALSGVQRQAAVQGIWVVAYVVATVLIFLLISQGRGIKGLAEAFFLRMIFEIGLSAVVAFLTLPWLKISPRSVLASHCDYSCLSGALCKSLGSWRLRLNSIERAVAVPLIGLQAAGLLDIGKKLPAMAASIPSAFASSFVPAASYLEGGLTGSEEGHEALMKLYLKGARYMNLAAGYVCGLLAAAPLPILDVWLGKRYPQAGFLMVSFAVATQVHLMTGPWTSILKGVGRPREEFWYAIPNILVLLLMLPLSRLVVGEWTAAGISAAVVSRQ